MNNSYCGILGVENRNTKLRTFKERTDLLTTEGRVNACSSES
jgi:hypothetical protein